MEKTLGETLPEEKNCFWISSFAPIYRAHEAMAISGMIA